MIRWPAAATLFAAGILVGLLAAKLPAFDISRQIDSGDLLNAATTILIALALGVIFQRTFIEARTEKDLLIAQARETGAALRLSRDTFLSAYTAGVSAERDSAILAALKFASMHITTLEGVCVECKLSTTLSHLAALKRSLRRYRLYLTERARTQRPYSDEEYQSSEMTYAQMQESLLKLMVAINKG